MANLSFDLKYGDTSLPVSIPEEDVIGVLTGKPAPVLKDLRGAIRDAMRNPINSPRLDEIVHPGETVAILVSDLTRAWARSDEMVPVLCEELNRIGIPDKDILIMIGVGSHRLQTPEECAQLVTKEVAGRIRIVDHDCQSSPMSYLGTTKFATRVSINKAIADADRLILTGGIVTHFLAGYGGGMKSILPGVASYETIMAHHKTSLGAVPGTINDDLRCGKTVGSVFYEDMVEAGRLARPDFLINTVMAPDGKIGRVVAGDPVTAHLAGCQTIDELFNTPIGETADIVVASCGGFPKDINFYQTSKSFYNAVAALKPGGTLVLLSESRESFGNPLVQMIATGFGTNVERHKHLQEDYEIGKWVGFLMTVYAAKYNILVMTSLSDDEVRVMGMTPVHSTKEAVERAYALSGPHPRVYVMPNAGSLLPIPPESCG